jgi:4-amino-4-deoxy-L-arabinose transferase-like glycosyltransferase
MLKEASARFAILAGLFMGLAALTRFTLEYFPLFLFFALLLPVCRSMEKRHRRNIFVFALVSLAVVGVWKIRNIIVLGAFSDPSLLVAGLQSGMYPDFMYNGLPESLGMPYRFDPRSHEFTNVSSVLSEVFRRFQTAPLLHLEWYLIGKTVGLLSWSMVDGWGDIFVYPVNKSPYFSLPLYQDTRLVMLLLHPFLMVTGFICMLIALLRPNWLGLGDKATMATVVLALLTIYFILLHMVGAPYPRYGVPLRPVMYGLSMVFLIVCIRYGFKRLKLYRNHAD